MDVKIEEGKYRVMTRGGTHQTGFHPVMWAQQVEALGAGEIFLNSIDRDGMKNGYDLDLINQVVDAVKIPVIACGGVGEWSHFAEALDTTAVDAIAAANIFNHMDQSVYLTKKYLEERKYIVRPADLFSF
jgi:cyclase